MWESRPPGKKPLFSMYRIQVFSKNLTLYWRRNLVGGNHTVKSPTEIPVDLTLRRTLLLQWTLPESLVIFQAKPAVVLHSMQLAWMWEEGLRTQGGEVSYLFGGKLCKQKKRERERGKSTDRDIVVEREAVKWTEMERKHWSKTCKIVVLLPGPHWFTHVTGLCIINVDLHSGRHPFFRRMID